MSISLRVFLEHVCETVCVRAVVDVFERIKSLKLKSGDRVSVNEGLNPGLFLSLCTQLL